MPTRTLRYEVQFASLRKTDRGPFLQRLRRSMDELRDAANRMIRILWLLDQREIPWPEAPRARGAQKGVVAKVPHQTLAYRLLSGDWKVGEDVVFANASGLLAQTFCTLTTRVLTRIKEDAWEVKVGKKSLPTFRQLPIEYPAVYVHDWTENNEFTLKTYKDGHNVRVRPRKLDGSRLAILRRIRTGEYKLGSVQLVRDQPPERHERWFVSISYTTPEVVDAPAPVTERGEGLVCGVDIGIRHAAFCVFVKPDGEVARMSPLVIGFPRRTLRAVERIEVERKQRSEYNRADLDLRSGRGRDRKLRPLLKIGDKVRRANDTMVSQIVSRVVRGAKAKGATLLVIEDHSGWSTEQLHDRADNARTLREGARIRRNYFRWHHGEMAAKLKQVAEREGLPCVAIEPEWTSRQCHQCGTVHKRDWIRFPLTEAEAKMGLPHLGRVDHAVFRCDCGPKDVNKGIVQFHADYNAAINHARRGITQVTGTLVGHDFPRVRKPKKKAKTAGAAPVTPEAK